MTRRVYSYFVPARVPRARWVHEGPLVRRVVYALGCYLGLRRANLLGLRWSGIDLENGTCTVLRTKNGAPVCFALHFPGLHALLRAWHEHPGRPAGDALVLGDLGCRAGREAQVLRADLKVAEVTREILFSGDPKVEPLRLHDAARHAGHLGEARRHATQLDHRQNRTLTGAMVERYTRAARTLADIHAGGFPELRGAFPNLPMVADASARKARRSNYSRPRTGPNTGSGCTGVCG